MQKTNVPALDKAIADIERDAKVLAVHTENLAGVQKIRETIKTPKKK